MIMSSEGLTHFLCVEPPGIFLPLRSTVRRGKERSAIVMNTTDYGAAARQYSVFICNHSGAKSYTGTDEISSSTSPFALITTLDHCIGTIFLTSERRIINA